MCLHERQTFASGRSCMFVRDSAYRERNGGGMTAVEYVE